MNVDWRFRMSLFAALNGFRRTFWCYGCIYLGIGVICASLFMFMLRPGFWLVWLLGIRFGWMVIEECDNWWWEQWTGPYPSPDLSFLLPPYLQEHRGDAGGDLSTGVGGASRVSERVGLVPATSLRRRVIFL